MQLEKMDKLRLSIQGSQRFVLPSKATNCNLLLNDVYVLPLTVHIELLPCVLFKVDIIGT